MLLALDLGSTIGWLKGAAVGPMSHGNIHLANTTNLGKWLASSDDGLRVAMRGATKITIEQPFMGKSWYPIRKLTALLGHVHYMADTYGIQITTDDEIPVASGKLALSGKGNATAEEMIEAAARNYGLIGLSEHEAHALGIWCFWQFGPGTPLAKARARSGKGRSVLKDAEA